MSSKTNAFNGYESKLNGGITDSATSLIVDAAGGMVHPAYLVLEPEDAALREVIKVGTIAGTTFSGLTRGLAGSASGAQAHASGAVIRSVPVHQELDDIYTDIIALEADQITNGNSHNHVGGDGGQIDHGGTGGLGDDDHTQYQTDARAVTWHDADDHSNLEESKEFSELGVLVTKNGTSRWYPRFNIAITDVSASVAVAPTGDTIEVDVNKNGTTIFSTQSNRPIIAAAAFFDVSGTPDVTALTGDTDYITVDIDQIGSTISGEDLVVSIGYKRT